MQIDEFRDAGHKIVDMLASYLENVEDRPLFPDVDPNTVTALFDEPLPQQPTEFDALAVDLEEKVLKYSVHVNHPGYFGLITPTPTPAGILGDFIAAALNQNVGSYTIGPSATAIERQTIRWMTDMVGYGEHAGGNLTSGGTMAHFIGVKLARDWASGNSAQHDGVRDQWAVYTSEERHVSVDKAVDAVGVGRNALRALPTDDGFRLRLDALEESIEGDKRAGVRPMCIVAMAGTTNTGAIDDLHALRAIADREGMWLHADAAYGGGMLLSNRWPGLLDGINLSDSIVMDPHKWFYAPLDAGAILVRDAERLTASFGLKPSYLTDELDTEGDRYQYYVHGFEQSRRFRSLKVWMTFKRYGAKQIGRWIDANVEQAQHLYELARVNPDFEVANKPTMSAICTRFVAPSLDENQSAQLHHEVVRRIEKAGRFWISTTVLRDRCWFRINPVNFRTRLEHMDELFTTLQKHCGELLAAHT